MSTIQKFTGALAFGPGKHYQTFEVYDHLRVGNDYLKDVKIPGAINTLLGNGKHCTLWIAKIGIPTPFFFKSQAHIVYAAEVDGQIYNATEETRRAWRTNKWLLVGALLLTTIVTLLMFIWPLFLINALRLVFVKLPIEQMRAAILPAPEPIENNPYPKQRGPRMPVKVSDKACPECGASLLRRDGTRGSFWGCSGWPECRHTEKYN